jgi:hypothetical protein
MSWNTQIVVVPSAGLADLAPAGLSPHGAKIEGDLAIEQDFLSAVEYDGGLILVGNVIDPDLCARLSADLQREVASAMFAGVSDTYAWQVSASAATRSWIVQQGETVEDTGAPLPAEAGVEKLDEDTLFALLDSYTGGLPDLTDAEAQPVRPSPVEPSDGRQPGRFRRLLGRG